MNVLLSGASGFMGRNFILRAPADWRIVALYRNDASFPEFVSGLNRRSVAAVRCDLADPAQVAAFVEQHGREWESCVYFSAKVDIPWSVREPKEDLLVNVAPVLNLLDAIQVGRLIYFSSGAVYDGLHGEAGPGALIAPTLPYAISKLAAEQYVQFYHRRRQSVDNYLVIRFFGAYGPYEAPHKIYTRLVKAFAIEGRKTYTIYGDGTNLIDAMYVDDAVEAVRRMLTGDRWNAVLNLANGAPLTIEALVREAAEALGVHSVDIIKEGVSHEKNDFWGSTREMQEWFGFQPRITLSEGFPRFRDFLAAQYTKSPSA